MSASTHEMMSALLARFVSVGACLLVAACAATGRVGEREVDARNGDERARFDVAVHRFESELDSARFTPPTEDRPMTSGAGRAVVPSDPKVSLVMESVDGGARYGFVELVGGGCGPALVPPPVVLFARGAESTRVVIVEPDVERRTRHVSGKCYPPGCGAQPPPPVERIHWLPITDPSQVTIERRRVKVVVESVTCDTPIPPA